MSEKSSLPSLNSPRESLGIGTLLGHHRKHLYAADDFPSIRTIYLSTIGLAVHAVVGCLAIQFCTPGMRIAVPITAAVIDLLLLWSILLDPEPGGQVKYRRNLMNTFLTVFLTVLLTSILFYYEWYPARTTWIYQQSSETKTHIPYPAVAFVSDYPAPFQADIIAPQDCYIGQWSADPQLCDNLSMDEVAEMGGSGLNASSSCSCRSNWEGGVHPNFVGFDHKPSIHFRPANNMVASSVQVFLNLRFSFSVNQSRFEGKGFVNGPNLWMLVYDSTISAATAYTTANGEYVLADVNSVNTVTMNPVFIRYRNGTGAYQYHVSLSSSQNSGVTCDVSGQLLNPLGKYSDCSALFLFRIQSFQSSVLQERRKLEWADFGASIGAYFALIQAGSWILSLLAFAT